MRPQHARIMVALLTALAACGGEAGETTSTSPAPTTATTVAATTRTAAATTSVAPTTTAAAATTTTAAAPVFAIDTDVFFPPVLGGSGDPHGSGCAPPGDVIPDGIWFGYATWFGYALAGAEGEISFDLACYFTGAAAEAAATADGVDTWIDNYIRNMNPKLFAVPIAASAEVYYIYGGADATDFFPQSIPVASWPSADSYLSCPGESCGVWLYVNGGVATGIVEQYQP